MSHIGQSNKKRESLLRSMDLHIQRLRSLEESERVRRACLAYLQVWYPNFYPDRPDLVAELQAMAAQLGGHLEPPRLKWKYAWMRPILGWRATNQVQIVLQQLKTSWLRRWDKTLCRSQAAFSMSERDVNARRASL